MFLLLNSLAWPWKEVDYIVTGFGPGITEKILMGYFSAALGEGRVSLSQIEESSVVNADRFIRACSDSGKRAVAAGNNFPKTR